MPLIHAQEKFAAAVHVLATGRGPLKQRLLDVFTLIDFCDVKINVPEYARGPASKMIERVTEISQQREGAFQTTIDQMSIEDAVQLAAAILEVEIYLRKLIS